MKLDPTLFRDYHSVVGGDYKDLWHVWLWWNEDCPIHNGAIIPTTWSGMMLFGNLHFEEKGYGVWVIPFFEAVETVLTKHGDKRGTLYIKYKW
jgi:hypothetical protein